MPSSCKRRRLGVLQTPDVNPAVAEYGADASGLICGFEIGAEGVATEIDSEHAALWADGRRGDTGRIDESRFVWLHFNLAHTGTVRWLAAHAGLAAEFYETLGDGLHSTRIEQVEQSLIAIVNDVHFDFAFEPSDISTLWLHVDRRLVVTVRRQPLRSVDKLRQAVKKAQALRSTSDLLEHLLRAQADVLVEIVRAVTDRIDAVEDQLLSKRLDQRRARLGALRRLLVRLQRLLAPEPGALFRLLQNPPRWMAELDVQGLRQSSEEFSVVLRDMSTLQERIKLLQEEIAAEINEGNNRSLFVLTFVTVLALPINLIAGLLGMNVGGIPLNQNPNGFWIVLAVVLSVTTAAGWIALRRRRQR